MARSDRVSYGQALAIPWPGPAWSIVLTANPGQRDRFLPAVGCYGGCRVAPCLLLSTPNSRPKHVWMPGLGEELAGDMYLTSGLTNPVEKLCDSLYATAGCPGRFALCASCSAAAWFPGGALGGKRE